MVIATPWIIFLPMMFNITCQPVAASAAYPAGGTSVPSPFEMSLPAPAPALAGSALCPTGGAPIHAFRVDYSNYATSRAEVGPLEARMQAAGINMVGLGAGRAEWAYFKWAGNEANWSNDVKDTGIDFLAEDTARFGKWAHIDAVVDVLAPSYIKAHPQAAAISFIGQPSTDFISTSELVYGDYGRQLLAMIEYIAANYPVNSISITELFYYSEGYGPDDKALYLAYSGRTDWPRLADGTIDRDAPSIGNWRTHMLDIFLDKGVAIAHRYGKEFYVDVKLNLSNLSSCSNECGTNYHVVLEHTDRIVVWAYYDLDAYAPEYLTTISQFLVPFGSNRVIVSLGLWDDIYPRTPADALRRAIISAQAGGMSNFWITPNTLMTPDHWSVLTGLWGPKPAP